MQLFPSKCGTECFKEVNILQSIFWVSSAWDCVLHSTIQKCFVHSGFVHKDVTIDDEAADVDVEEDVPLKVLQLSNMLDCEFAELAATDKNFQTWETVIDWDKPAGQLSDIAAECFETATTNDDDADDEDAALYALSVISIGKVRDCISILQDYAGYHGHPQLLATIINISDRISEIWATSCTKQTSIVIFFKL